MSRKTFQRLALDERRQSLMEATLTCVARHGLDGTTVRRITEEAGVTPGLVRHYFGSKEELIKNAYAYLIGQLTARASESADTGEDGPPAAQQLRQFLLGNLTSPNLSEDKVSLWATFIGQIRHDPFFAEIHREGYREFLEFLERLVEGVLIDHGLPHRGPQCRRHAIAINGLIDGLWMEGSLNSGLYNRAILPDLAIEATERLLGLPTGALGTAGPAPHAPAPQLQEENAPCAMPE
ncbi:TetR/AcrR family transcriptional regulator [Novosphingobium mangrovi (ex Hu et al. 2023)]|uniref:TetR family transcriptional regulator C-terminal domain-containing protein n=1 Tax=Novosphingobium mangrovi (ex Hu et al. 2023) TaxID=2930094 RepID=A0ABT0ABB2_9SPHN|nr:TetR family transcriptional regulator C-terminal domain-containing protein [Novosphingobium mangrovi (ex Hu et al. 2023)]MCJ1960472.1 TetR family transcriptional regulator C-terminal domain-containing protein [Novosphingobium mangrovi (ex Hu et al. 2023)]